MAGNVPVVFVLLCVVAICVHATAPVRLACQGTSKDKLINLVQPTDISGSCTYNIVPYSTDVCQLKVEFTTNLAQPTSSSVIDSPTCKDEYIQIGKHKICGVNSNQHLYLHLDGSSSDGITVITKPNGGVYQITITQVVCSSNSTTSIYKETDEVMPVEDIQPQITDTVAPRGCDQYYTNSLGVVESFNFDGGEGPYPGGLQYTICFKTPSSSSSLKLYGLAFSLGYNAADQTNKSCYDLYEGTPGISSDYVMVPLSNITNTEISADQYCGTILKSKTVESTMFGTFWFVFKSGNYLNGNNVKRVFQFIYQVA